MKRMTSHITPPVIRWMAAYRERDRDPVAAVEWELDRPAADTVSAEPLLGLPTGIGRDRLAIGLLVDQERALLIGGWDHDVWSEATAGRDAAWEEAISREREADDLLAAVADWEDGRRPRRCYGVWGQIKAPASWAQARELEERAYDALAHARALYQAARGHAREEPQARTWEEVARLRRRDRHGHAEVLCAPLYSAVVLRTCGTQTGRMEWLRAYLPWCRDLGLGLALLDDQGRLRWVIRP